MASKTWQIDLTEANIIDCVEERRNQRESIVNLFTMLNVFTRPENLEGAFSRQTEQTFMARVSQPHSADLTPLLGWGPWCSPQHYGPGSSFGVWSLAMRG
jgi:hypothetical protein